jgi:hypothetical protein
VKASGPRAHGVSIITIPTSIKTNRVRVDIASRSVKGWNEIDAIGLLDASGKTHWATGATASSTYAERPTAIEDSFSTTQRLQYRHAIIQAQQAQAEADAASVMVQLAEQNRRKSLDTRDWSPDQATGAPADLSVASVNDRRHAWRPAKADAGRETLDVFYIQPVKAKLILVYELGVPAVVDITCRGNDGATVRVLAGRDVKTAQATTVLSLPLDGRTAINSVTLSLDTAAAEGWTDIDAVGLIDAEGKLHWADRAMATSMHGVVAEKPWKSSTQSSAAQLGIAWLKTHQSNMSKSSCVSCHQNEPREVERVRDAVRVPVRELLDMNDAELREFLKSHGAANIHIGDDGQATLDSAALKSILEREAGGSAKPTSSEDGTQDQPGQSQRSVGSNVDPNAQGAVQPAAGTGAEPVTTQPKSAAQLALDMMSKKDQSDWSDLAAGRDDTMRLEEYEKAYRAQAEAEAHWRESLEGQDREKLRDWIAMKNMIAGPEQVQIALPAGERGYFSRPNWRAGLLFAAQLPHRPGRARRGFQAKEPARSHDYGRWA